MSDQQEQLDRIERMLKAHGLAIKLMANYMAAADVGFGVYVMEKIGEWRYTSERSEQLQEEEKALNRDLYTEVLRLVNPRNQPK